MQRGDVRWAVTDAVRSLEKGGEKTTCRLRQADREALDGLWDRVDDAVDSFVYGPMGAAAARAVMDVQR